VLKPLGRYSESPSGLNFALDGTVYRALGTSDDLDHDSIDQRVLKALASGPRTIQALMEELNLSYKVISDCLDRLELASEVTRQRLGKGKGNPLVFSLRTETYPNQTDGDKA
jgi:predicted Rossmann fold nucleotide-binding protein DprA/Smf involved in DNA uptake